MRQKDREFLFDLSGNLRYDSERCRRYQMRQALSQNIAQDVGDKLPKACLCNVAPQGTSRSCLLQ